MVLNLEEEVVVLVLSWLLDLNSTGKHFVSLSQSVHFQNEPLYLIQNQINFTRLVHDVAATSISIPFPKPRYCVDFAVVHVESPLEICKYYQVLRKRSELLDFVWKLIIEKSVHFQRRYFRSLLEFFVPHFVPNVF